MKGIPHKNIDESFNENPTKWSDDCLIWKGVTTDTGYGRFWYKGKWYLAHRYALSKKLSVSYDSFECACHTCNNRNCVNPDHLWLGTRADSNKNLINKKQKIVSYGKLNKKQVLEIREKFKEGILKVVLSSSYNVSLSTISDIVANRTWKDI